MKIKISNMDFWMPKAGISVHFGLAIFLRGWWFAVLALSKTYLIGIVYLLKEYYTKKFGKRKAFSLEDLPSRHGCIAIVTGGTEGIGFETVNRLLSKEMRVIIGANVSHEECREKRTLLKERYPLCEVDVFPLDLSSMSSVKTFASDFLKTKLRLHLLINNAGVMHVPHFITCDGFEKHMAVNYLSHCLLTRLLLPRMAESGTANLHSRVVFVSSAVHFVGYIDFDDLQGIKCYSKYHSYLQSKLAIVLMTYQMQKYIVAEGYNVTVNCLHPGVVYTQLYKYTWWASLIGPCVFKTASEGSETVLYASLSEEMESIGGKYLEDCSVLPSSRLSYDEHLQTRMWHLTWKMLDKWL